jgi:hypothetical protein
MEYGILLGRGTDMNGSIAVNNIMEKYGCLPTLNDMRTLEVFSPEGMSQAIEHEANKAAEYGFSKITLHMDIPDAILLAKALRKVK